MNHKSDNIKFFYDYEGKLATDPIVNFIRINGKKLNGRLLDVGCGNKPYKQFFLNIHEYLGIDLSNKEADFIGNAKFLPFKDKSFDVILCSQVIEHDPEPLVILKEINRILCIGGTLIITAPQMGRLHGEPHDYYRYTKWGLKYLLDSCGFTISLLEPQGGFFRAIGSHLNFYLLNNFCSTESKKKIIRKTIININNRLFSYLDKRLYWDLDTLGYNIVATKIYESGSV